MIGREPYNDRSRFLICSVKNLKRDAVEQIAQAASPPIWLQLTLLADMPKGKRCWWQN
jgi:hypothetical protein